MPLIVLNFFLFFWNFILFFSFIFISWRLITLQHCSDFCHTLTWISHRFTCVSPSRSPLLPPSPSDPSGSSQCTRPEHLSHASNLGWWCVSPLIVYLFQCYSLRNPILAFSHRIPKSVLYICVSLFCFAYRLPLPSFKIPYICVSILYWSLSFWLTSLCIMGSSFIHLIRTDSNEFF